MVNLYIRWGYTFCGVPIEGNTLLLIMLLRMFMLKMLVFMFCVNQHKFSHSPPSNLHIVFTLNGVYTLVNVVIIDPIQVNIIL